MEPADSTEPIEPAEPNEPIEPTEHADKHRRGRPDRADGQHGADRVRSTASNSGSQAREWSRASPSDERAHPTADHDGSAYPTNPVGFIGIMPRALCPPFATTSTSTSGPSRSSPRSSGAPSRRSCARTRDGLTLVLAGEPEAPFDPAPHDPRAAARRSEADGIDRVLVCLSSPARRRDAPARRGAAGPRRLARRRVRARRAVRRLGRGRARRRRAPRTSTALLDRGAVGISLPAAAFATAGGRRARAARSSPRSRRATAPLLVHPGAAPGGHARRCRGGRASVTLRRRAPRGLARLRRLGAPAPTRRLRVRVRRARRRRAAARRAPRRARRPGARGVRPADLLRHVLLRPAGRSRPSAASSASTSSSTARTGPVVGPPPDHRPRPGGRPRAHDRQPRAPARGRPRAAVEVPA